MGRVRHRIRRSGGLDLSKLLFVFSAALLVFGYGILVGRYRIFPFAWINYAVDSLVAVYSERGMITQTHPAEHLAKSRYPGSGVTRFDRGRTSPGLTLIAGFFEGGLQLRLVQPDGVVVNRWPVRFHELFPDARHIEPAGDTPATDWNASIHGAAALPDGSVVFSFYTAGAVRLDRCGNVVWTLPQMTHHSIEPSSDGNFWIQSRRFVERDSPFRTLNPPYDHETALKVSPSGEILREMSLLKIFFENGLDASVLFASGMSGLQLPEQRDVTHINDVEELTTEMAPHFPQFAAGDLLISERDYNLVMVVDPASGKVKWRQQGPWLKQHDPDFEATGRIRIFSNNDDGTETGDILGGSTLVEVDPVTGETWIVYGGRPDQKMFSRFKGNHQTTANGNILITESYGGRVFEITPGGELVWEYVNRYDEDEVALVSDGIRYPETHFTVRDWTCD